MGSYAFEGVARVMGADQYLCHVARVLTLSPQDGGSLALSLRARPAIKRSQHRNSDKKHVQCWERMGWSHHEHADAVDVLPQCTTERVPVVGCEQIVNLRSEVSSQITSVFSC